MTNSTLDMSCGADAIARNWRSWLSGDNTCAPPPALSQTGNECEDLACDSGKKRRGSCASNEAEQSVVLRKKTPRFVIADALFSCYAGQTYVSHDLVSRSTSKFEAEGNDLPT
jgi:hypothetical protein